MSARDPAVGSNPVHVPMGPPIKPRSNPRPKAAADNTRPATPAAIASEAADFVKRQGQRRDERLNNAETDLANISSRLEKLHIVINASNAEAVAANARRRRRGSGNGSNASMPTLATGGTVTTTADRKLASLEEEALFWTHEKERVLALRDRLNNKKIAVATSKKMFDSSTAVTEATTASTTTSTTTSTSISSNEKQQRQQPLPSVGEEVDEQDEESPAHLPDAALSGFSGLGRRDYMAAKQAHRQRLRDDAQDDRSSATPSVKPPVSKIDFSDESVKTSISTLTPTSDIAALGKPKTDDDDDEEAAPEALKITSLEYMYHRLRMDEITNFPGDLSTSMLSPETVANAGLKKIAQAVLRGRDGILRNLETLNLSGCGIDNHGVKLLLEELRYTLHYNHRSFRRCRLRLLDLRNNPEITSDAAQDLVDILHLIASITEFLVDNQDSQTMKLIECVVKARKNVEEDRAERRKPKEIAKRQQEADGKVGAEETTSTSITKQEHGTTDLQRRKLAGRRLQSKMLRKYPDTDLDFVRKFGLDMSLVWFGKQVDLAASAPVTVLNLSGQLIGDAGVEVLITILHSCGGSRHLTNLSLDANKITSKGAKVLSQYLLGIKSHVSASVNMETKEDEDPVSVEAELPALKYLQLEWNLIGEEGAADLSRVIRNNTNISELFLGRNHLGDTGTIAIADAIWKTRQAGEPLKLIELSLIGNDIGYLGVSRIADCVGPIVSGERHASPSSVQRLRLGDNLKIGQEANGLGIERLVSAVEAATNDKNDSLTYLSLWRCSVSADMEKKLRALVEARAANPAITPLTVFLDVHDTGKGGKKDVTEQSGNDEVMIAFDDEPTRLPTERKDGDTSIKMPWEDLAWLSGTYEGEVGLDGLPHGRGTFVTDNGGKKYEGQWVNGARTGWGKGQWASGAEYRGYWLDGLRNGRGWNKFEDSKEYDGDFRNGDRHGYGRQENRDGTVYEGYWQNNYRNGPGVHRKKTGAIIFEGQWNCNVPAGKRTSARPGRGGMSVVMSKGTSRWSSQSEDSRPSSGVDHYDEDWLESDSEYDTENASFTNLTNVEEIEWIDACWGFGKYSGSVNAESKPHGSGEFRSEEGNIYTGEFVQGERTGYGVAKWKSGSTYDGNWKRGRRHGFGRNVRENGSEFNGMWRRNEHHGEGTEFLLDGSTRHGDWEYGNFVNEKKETRGVDSVARSSKSAPTKTATRGQTPIVYSDNMWGNGVFAGSVDPNTGLPDGEGEFDQSDGRWYDGGWKNGRRHGYGCAGWPMNSTEYDGEWVDGKRHGSGTATYSNGSRYRGEWRDNQRDGKGVFIGPDGQFWKGTWRKDEMMLEEEQD